LNTPLRRLEGVSYWVIADPDAIYDFVNAEIRREWEADARREQRNPEDDPWLTTLAKRTWNLDTIAIAKIKLNPDIMNHRDPATGYTFLKSLERRTTELLQAIKLGGVVLSPLVVRGEDLQLGDGYCRYTTLKAMSVPRIYVYVGSL
jgi:hypothetical protein